MDAVNKCWQAGLQAYKAAAFVTFGTLNFTRSAFLKHAKDFIDEEMQVDMAGKRCVITGANQGIGFASAEALASRGATVYLVCRSKEKGEKAVEDIKSKTGNSNVSLEVCDLSSMQQIRDFARRYSSSDQPLHVLVNNAGLMEHEYQLTVDGLETNFAVNVAGVYAMTELLLPALERASPESRVINVASGGMYTEALSGVLQYEDKNKLDGLAQYARNKRVQVALSEYWAEKYGSKGIGFYSMHPGWVDTSALKKSMPAFKSSFQSALRNAEEGADTIVWLALQNNTPLENGAFYFDRVATSKHWAGFGTTYAPNEVSPIVAKIHALCGLQAQTTTG